MRKKRKFYGALLIITAVLIMQIPVSEADAAASASDFQMKGSRLVKYTGSSESVAVPSDVETVGESAFEGNTAVKRISIPSSVKKIEQYAFWGCDSLESVTLGAGLTEISDYSFANCKGLRSMSIPSNIRSIGIRAFADCVNLTDISIPGEVTHIDETAFDGCARLEISSPPGSTAAAFAERFAEKQAEMPEYQDVPGYGSAGTDAETGDGIGAGGTAAADGAGGTITGDASGAGGAAAGDGAGTGGAVTGDGAGTEAAGDGGDSGLPGGPAAENRESGGDVLGSTHVVGNQAVVFMDNTAQTVLEGAPQGQPGAETGGEAPSQEQMAEKGAGFPKYTLVDSRTVADQAYYLDVTRSELDLPAGVAEIGEFSFARSALQQAVLPEGVRKVGYGAFYHCDDMTRVTLPESLEKVEPKAFDHTAWVEGFLKMGKEDFLISGGVLAAYRGNSYTVEIPEGVRVIAAEVFSGHGEIYKVSLPESLSVIGEAAFENCGSLQEVTGGGGVAQIADRAFAGCPLVAVNVGPAVRSIGLGAFDFTGTAKEDAAKTAVFTGTALPAASYENTASRLSNEPYRKSALSGVLFAVVDPAVTEEEIRRSVLGPGLAPFRGITGSIGEDGSFYCRFTNLTAGQLAEAAFPDQVYLEADGAYHPVTGTENMVLLPHEAGPADTSAEGAGPDGASDALDGEGGRAPADAAGDGTEQDGARDKTEQGAGVRVTGTVAGATAMLEGAVREYELQIREAEDASAMQTAYQRSCQVPLPESAAVYELVLSEPENHVPLTKLGGQALTVTMPVPEQLAGQALQVLTLDRNGQLEAVSSAQSRSEDGSFIRFTANHLSLYGFVGRGELSAQTEVLDGEAVFTQMGGRKDDSPDTGDFLHPKYYLGMGLLFAGAAVFLSGTGRMRRKKTES